VGDRTIYRMADRSPTTGKQGALAAGGNLA
jgi:hypothetical protein